MKIGISLEPRANAYNKHIKKNIQEEIRQVTVSKKVKREQNRTEIKLNELNDSNRIEIEKKMELIEIKQQNRNELKVIEQKMEMKVHLEIGNVSPFKNWK